MAAGILTAVHQQMTPGLCMDLCGAGQQLYGIDYQTTQQLYRIYCCSGSGTDAISIVQRAEQHGRRNVYDQAIYDAESGEFYVHLSEFSSGTGLMRQERVLRCNFQKQKLESVWEIPSDTEDRTAASAVTCMVQSGELYYLTETEQGLQVYCQNDRERTAVRRVTVSDDVTFSDFRFGSDGKLYGFSTVSGLYREDDTNVLQPLSGQKNAWDSYVCPAWGADGAACLDLTHSQEIRYIQETGKTEVSAMTQTYPAAAPAGQELVSCTLDADMLTNCCLFGGDGFAGYGELPETLREGSSHLQSGLAVYQGGKMTLYPSLQYSSAYLWRYGVFWFLVLFFGSGLLLLLCRAAYGVFRKRQYVSIRLEMTLFAALLFGSAIGCASFAIYQIIGDAFAVSYQKVFDDLEQQICTELDTVLSQTESASQKTIFSREFHQTLEELMQNTSIQNPETGEEEFAPYFVFHGTDAAGQLIVLYNSSGTEQIPTSYVYDNSYLAGEYQAVLTDHRHRNLTQYDTEGTWNVQLCYYENTASGVQGVVEIGIDQYLTDWKVRQVTQRIIWFTVLLCMVMVAAVILFLGRSFAPLQRLGVQIQQGNVEKPGKSRWNREISAIWERLYVMIRSSRQRLENVEVNNQQHYRLISDKLVHLLGPLELADAVPGAQRKCDVFLVAFVCEPETPQQGNQLYAALLPLIEQLGGILCEIHPCHGIWLFPRKIGDPAAAAEQIRQTAARQQISCGVGTGNGVVTIFVRGTETCADLAVSGEALDQARQTAEAAFRENIGKIHSSEEMRGAMK